MKSPVISLFEKFGSNVLIRNKMIEIFQEISSIKSEKVVVDFDKIQFISRSCADEYLKQKTRSPKTIEEINVVSTVSEMLDVVRVSRENFFQISRPEVKNGVACYA